MNTRKIRYFETSATVNLARCNNSEQSNLRRYIYTDHDGALTGNILLNVLPGE
jgi:hypothetical protein